MKVRTDGERNDIMFFKEYIFDVNQFWKEKCLSYPEIV